MNSQNSNAKFETTGIFNYTSDGFNITLESGQQFIKWDEIEKIEAYKVDLMTIDEICMDITFYGKTITITEETDGWYVFIENIKRELSLAENWEALVLKTPFELDWTVVYEKIDTSQFSSS